MKDEVVDDTDPLRRFCCWRAGAGPGRGIRAVRQLRRVYQRAVVQSYAYSPYWATPYTYPATASSVWGYPYWYGSNSPWTGQASASSHPAYYGGSGGYAYHPAYGFGY